MNVSDLKYQLQTASKEDIHMHLKECDGSFIPPLSDKVDLDEYSQKIKNNAITFEAWSDSVLVGLVVGYFNDTEKKVGFITNVSLMNEWSGKGVAVELMNRCIEHAKKHDINEIDLEVSNQNIRAIQLYKKLNFVDFEKKGNMITMKLNINNV